MKEPAIFLNSFHQQNMPPAITILDNSCHCFMSDMSDLLCVFHENFNVEAICFKRVPPAFCDRKENYFDF